MTRWTLGESIEWFRPTTLNELVELKKQYPTAKIVSGHTMIQIDRKFKDKCYPVLIAVGSIPELNRIEKTERGIIVGACVSVAKLKEYCELCLKMEPTYRARTCQALLSQLNIFGSQQIRNVATIGGNIVHGSPISTLNPMLVACNAKLKLINCDSNEEYEMTMRELFADSKKTDLGPSEILLSVFISFTGKDEYLQSYKQAKRRKLDIPIVSCGFQVELAETPTSTSDATNGARWTIQSMCLALGSMAPSTIMMAKTQAYLAGKPWCKQTVKDALKCLLDELPLDEFTPGGQPEYR